MMLENPVIFTFDVGESCNDVGESCNDFQIITYKIKKYKNTIYYKRYLYNLL